MGAGYILSLFRVFIKKVGLQGTEKKIIFRFLHKSRDHYQLTKHDINASFF